MDHAEARSRRLVGLVLAHVVAAATGRAFPRATPVGHRPCSKVGLVQRGARAAPRPGGEDVDATGISVSVKVVEEIRGPGERQEAHARTVVIVVDGVGGRALGELDSGDDIEPRGVRSPDSPPGRCSHRLPERPFWITLISSGLSSVVVQAMVILSELTPSLGWSCRTPRCGRRRRPRSRSGYWSRPGPPRSHRRPDEAGYVAGEETAATRVIDDLGSHLAGHAGEQRASRSQHEVPLWVKTSPEVFTTPHVLRADGELGVRGNARGPPSPGTERGHR